MHRIEAYLSQRPERLIHHYTGAAAAISILENKKLWASKINHLNDASEYVHAKEWLKGELTERGKGPASLAIKTILDRVAGTTTPTYSPLVVGAGFANAPAEEAPVYVVSFSEEENLLSQWRAYSNAGDGYSLGFDASELPFSPLSTLQLVKCVYTEEERKQLCEDLIDSWDQYDVGNPLTIMKVMNIIMTVMAGVKHHSFREEKEWRLVSLNPQELKFREGRHGIVPYTELGIDSDQLPTLKRIWIGPNSNSVAADHALSLLTKKRFSEVDRRISEIPFRR